MIGLSSGSWAQIAVHLPGVKKLTIIEINPGYGELIEKYDWVKSLLTNPKVELVFDDGRRWLQRNPDRKFDVIFQNTTQHWRAHSTNLLSLEYLELSEKRLLPGGMVFYNTTWSEDALRTGAEAFPYAMRVINFVVGSNAPIHVDKERWEQILRTMRIDDTPILPLGCNKAEAECQEVLETFDKLIAFPDTLDAEPVKEGLESRKNLLARMDHARVITDDNMRSEWYRLFW